MLKCADQVHPNCYALIIALLQLTCERWIHQRPLTKDPRALFPSFPSKLTTTLRLPRSTLKQYSCPMSTGLGLVNRTGIESQDLAGAIFCVPFANVLAMAEMFRQWHIVHFSAGTNDPSPLYAALAAKIADDKELLAVALGVVHVPMPLILVASVQYLLFQDVNHPLAKYYASVHDPALPFGEHTYMHFRKFVLANRVQLIPLLKSRLVQTNEVRRCALLLPALHVALQDNTAPVAFIELGASAGLNLNVNRYSYCYTFSDGHSQTVGDPNSPLQLTCDVRGNFLPLPTALPQPTHRIGLDLNPLDAHNDEHVMWLKSLIWPEHRERRARLLAAVDVARKYPVQHMNGDAVERIREAFAHVPLTTTVVVYHSLVLNQFPQELLQKLRDTMKELSRTRPFVQVGVEFVHQEKPVAVSLTRWNQGESQCTQLAECNSHGTWLKWLDQQ